MTLIREGDIAPEFLDYDDNGNFMYTLYAGGKPQYGDSVVTQSAINTALLENKTFNPEGPLVRFLQATDGSPLVITIPPQEMIQ